MIITYFIPILSVFAFVSAYFWGVNISFADLAERADTSAVIVIATTFTLVWLLFLSQEQSICWGESLTPQYAYDVLFYALHNKVDDEKWLGDSVKGNETIEKGLFLCITGLSKNDIPDGKTPDDSTEV